jgi:hypothetical protein
MSQPFLICSLSRRRKKYWKIAGACSEFHEWQLHLNTKHGALYRPYSLVPDPQNFSIFLKCEASTVLGWEGANKLCFDTLWLVKWVPRRKLSTKRVPPCPDTHQRLFCCCMSQAFLICSLSRRRKKYTDWYYFVPFWKVNTFRYYLNSLFRIKPLLHDF